MRVLVAYASRRGGTAGLAAMIGDAFGRNGWEVDVRRAGDVHDLAEFDVVVVASALYMGRWLGEARRFLRRHADELRTRHVWLVSSGPLTRDVEIDTPPPRAVKRLAVKVNAYGHAMFGGRLLRDARGFPARVMARSSSGDYRDPARVQAWVSAAVARVRTVSARVRQSHAQPEHNTSL